MMLGPEKSSNRNILTKLAAIVAYPVLSALMRRMDYTNRYNGAALLEPAWPGVPKPWFGGCAGF